MKRAVILLLILTNVCFAELVRVIKIEAEWHKYYDKLFIETSADIKPRILILKDRLVLDFKGAKVDKSQTITLKKSTRIASVRMGQFKEDTARVVIDLKKAVDYDYATIYGKNGIWLEIVDPPPGKAGMIRYEKESKETKVAEVPKAPTPTPLLKVAEKAVEVKPKAEVDKKPVKAEPKVATKPLAGKMIVVDPGHGGSDPGAKGPGGVWEKEVTLKVGLYLAEYLRSKGAKVYLTRTTDRKMSLQGVVALIKRVRANAYVGVHFNSVEDPKVSGTETFYYTPQSMNLAIAIHNSLLKRIRRTDRGVKRAKFYTISNTETPAVIIEPIYMTNYQDGRLIESKSFQKEVARDVALGIMDFF